MSLDTNNTTHIEDTITTLVIKHVPPVIGGSQAYAYFQQYNALDAAEAYDRLQQLSRQGEEYKKVRVEYAKPDPKRLATRERPSQIPKQQQTSSSTIPLIPLHQPPKPIETGEPIAPHLGINYPANPDLQYQYPDPTPEILNNMMHAIATVPRLYVQTLHLMNKMNLPPPFGPIQNESIPSLLSHKRKHDELIASDESELESDEEQKDKEKQKVETRSKILAAHEQKRASLLKSTATGNSKTSGGTKKIMLGTKK